MECATCLADLYPPELIAEPEFDPEDTLPPLYDRYVLLPRDNEEVVVSFLVALHAAHLQTLTEGWRAPIRCAPQRPASASPRCASCLLPLRHRGRPLPRRGESPEPQETRLQAVPGMSGETSASDRGLNLRDQHSRPYSIHGRDLPQVPRTQSLLLYSRRARPHTVPALRPV